jgi:ribosomal protein S18 acetylase RimI-like enzyme
VTFNVSIDTTQDPAPEDVRQVIQGLVSFNVQHAGPEDWQKLAAFVRDSNGNILGGVVGEKHWNWLFVSHLWLVDELRRQGIGQGLMARLETMAVASGCDAVHLDTYDFQALGFYERLGFRLFGELADCPTDHSRYFLWKPLDPEEPSKTP